MNHDVRNVETVDGEINIWELMERLKNRWQWLVGGGIAGFVGAFGFVVLTPAQYEATAMIQPATIGMIAAPATATTTMTVEPVAQTLERLKLVTFYSDDIVKTCQVDSAKELANSVKAGLAKGNTLLSIGYRANSAALAEACVAKIVVQLTQSQAVIADSLIKELEEQRTTTKQQIEDAERFLKQSERLEALSSNSNGLSILLMLKRDELMKLQKLYREQRLQLTEPLTHPMKLLGPIYAPEKAIWPKKSIAAVGGLVLGVFVGLLALLVARFSKQAAAVERPDGEYARNARR